MDKLKTITTKIFKFILSIWNKNKYGKITVIITSLLLIGFIFGSNESADLSVDSQSTLNKTQTIQPEDPSLPIENKESPKKEKKLTPKEEFTSTIKDIFKDDFKKITDGPDEITIYVNLSDNLTNSFIVRGFQSDVFDSLEKLQKNQFLYNSKRICFIAETTFLNKYGEENIGNALISSFETNDIKKINFENIIDLADVFTSFDSAKFIHPSLK